MNEKIAILCRRLDLGELLCVPQSVSGGYLHKMFRAETTRGVFALKALNPEIMARPEALGNMRAGELANAAFAHCPTFDVCASIGGVTEVDGSCFIAYPWVAGAPVYQPEITVEHCRIMGHVLGSIHRADVRIPEMKRNDTLRRPYDWSALEDDRLSRWDAAALEGLRRLQGKQVISHRDLDPKNVMWQGMRPCVIDWEAAGYVNPWQELIELLNYWAEDEAGALALIGAYRANMDTACADWEAALAAGMDGMLGWLHYNMGQPDGAAHVRGTLEELARYEERSNFLRRILP